jgi:hypothetical protein
MPEQLSSELPDARRFGDLIPGTVEPCNRKLICLNAAGMAEG